MRHFCVIFKHYVAFFSSFFSPGFAVFKRGLKRKKERRKWQWEAAILLSVFVDQIWFYNAMQYSMFLLLQGKKQRRIEEAGEKLSRYNIDMRVWRPSYRVSSLSQGDFCFVVMSILYYSHLWSQIGRGVPWIVSIHAIGGGHTTSGRTS